MSIERSRLKNGIKVIAQDFPNSSTVSVAVAVKTGSRNENDKIMGISHFLEHMLVKGTQKYPKYQDLLKEIDSLGGEFNAATSKEFTYFYLKSAKGYFEKMLKILEEIVFHSLLNKDELEKERGTIIEEINMYKDHPRASVYEQFYSILFKNSLLSHPILGEKKTIQSISREDMKKYYDYYYRGENAMVSVAGNLPKDYKKIIRGIFADNEKGKPKGLPFSENKNYEKKVSLENKKIEQAHLMLGVEGYDLGDKRRYAADLISIVLGGSMSSRLMDEIREKRGLAYYVNSMHDALSDCGYFVVKAGVTLNKTEEAIRIIKKECQKITRDISDEEIDKAKKYVYGNLALEEENSLNVVSDQIDEFWGVRTETLKEKREKYNSVSKKEIKEVAKDLFSNNDFKLALIGPFKDEQTFAKILVDK